MENNERFGQIEALLADLLRRVDRVVEQMSHQSEQIGDIINILKISDARQTRMEERMEKAEERQERMLAEIKQQGLEIKQQGQEIKQQNQEIKQQGGFIESMLRAQGQLLTLIQHNAAKTDDLSQRIPTIVAYEARFQRLEEAVFKQAS